MALEACRVLQSEDITTLGLEDISDYILATLSHRDDVEVMSFQPRNPTPLRPSPINPIPLVLHPASQTLKPEPQTLYSAGISPDERVHVHKQCIASKQAGADALAPPLHPSFPPPPHPPTPACKPCTSRQWSRA
jgi:hypothetical protein